MVIGGYGNAENSNTVVRDVYHDARDGCSTG